VSEENKVMREAIQGVVFSR